MRKDGGRMPHGASPVKNIEISESHLAPRAVFAAIFLVIGIAAITLCVKQLFNTDYGWQDVEIYLSEPSVADEFTLSCYFGASGRNPTAENKLITSLYSDACVKAYKLFDSELLFDGVNNVAYINAHPNEEIAVDDVLYSAFLKWEEYGGRYLYLAPVYNEYGAAFFGIEMPESAAELDPYVNAEFAWELAELSAFASNKEHVSVKMLGENKVMLYVSDEYLEFAKEHEITEYIDFYRTKNAFIADYFAEIFADNGFCEVTVSSHDGYTRNLSVVDNEQAFGIFGRVEDTIYPAASLKYKSPMAFAVMSDFPLSERDSYRYYTKNGHIIAPFIDPDDGLYKTAASSMVAYSSSAGCADILLQMLPLYASDEVDMSLIKAYSKEGTDTVLCDGFTVYHTEKDAILFGVFADEDVAYSVVYMGE